MWEHIVFKVEDHGLLYESWFRDGNVHQFTFTLRLQSSEDPQQKPALYVLMHGPGETRWPTHAHIPSGYATTGMSVEEIQVLQTELERDDPIWVTMSAQLISNDRGTMREARVSISAVAPKAPGREKLPLKEKFFSDDPIFEDRLDLPDN